MAFAIRPASLSYRQADTANEDNLPMTRLALIYSDITDPPDLFPVLNRRVQDLYAILARRGLSFDTFARRDLPSSLDGYDLVIAAGGDGTQLDSARRLTDTPLCGVRLLPEKSVGFLCGLDYSDFEAFIDRYLAQNLRYEHISRLQCVIDGEPKPFAILNDALIAHACPARASRFLLKFRQHCAHVCSSGIWVATQPGSHGAAKAAGATPLDENDANLAVYCVRECSRCELLSNSDSLFELSSAFELAEESPIVTLEDNSSVLYSDGGIVQHPLHLGQTVCFQKHASDLIRVF